LILLLYFCLLEFDKFHFSTGTHIH
jgi:hypothetical protein